MAAHRKQWLAVEGIRALQAWRQGLGILAGQGERHGM
jgi:hypothetical protein